MTATERPALRRQLRANARQPVERRIYVLPKAQVAAVLQHAINNGYPSEVAAARALLNEALTVKGFPREWKETGR